MTSNTLELTRFTLRVPEDTMRRLDSVVSESPLSKTGWILEAIAEKLLSEEVKQNRLDELEARLLSLESLVTPQDTITDIPISESQVLSPEIEETPQDTTLNITPVTFTQAAAELKARGRPICRRRLKKRLVDSASEVPAELFELGLRCDRTSFDRGADKWLYFVEQKEVN